MKKFKVGQSVKFVQNPSMQGEYIPEFQQLVGQTGLIIRVGSVFYTAEFDGFKNDTGTTDFYCLEDELEAC